MDLGELLEELEWSHPAVPTLAVAVDLGDPPDDLAAGREAVAALLVGALDVAAAALRGPVGETTAAVLVLARAVHLITSAHLRVAGRLP